MTGSARQSSGAIATLVPVLALLLLAAYVAWSEYGRVQRAMDGGSAVRLAGTIGRLVHSLQLERGRSADFVAGNERREALLDQWHRSDELGRELGSQERTASGVLTNLKQFRTAVSHREITVAAAVAAYSSIIDHLEQIAQSRLSGANPLLFTLATVRQLKEAYGRERAVGVAILRRGEANPELRSYWQVLRHSQRLLAEDFAQNAAKRQWDQWSRLAIPEALRAVDILRAEGDLSLAGTPMQARADPWFATVTDLIERLHRLETEVLAELEAGAAARIATGWTALAVVITGAAGIALFVSAALIRARRSANLAQDLLEQALGSIDEGFVLWDADRRLAMWNRRFAEIFAGLARAGGDPARHLIAGTSVSELMAHFSAACGTQDAEDWRRRRIVAQPQSKGVAEVEFRSGKWLRITERPLADGGTVEVYVDISELKNTAEALRHNRDQLRKLHRAVEQSPASVLITDVTGRIAYVNEAFCRISGFGRDEVIGQNPRLLKSERTRPETYRDLWSTILGGREWRGELCNRKKSGEYYWESAIISPVMDEYGRVVEFIGIKTDISDFKNLENALRLETDNTRRILDNMTDGVLLVNRSCRIDYANPAMRRAFGDFAGRPCQSYLFDSAIPCVGCHLARDGESAPKPARPPFECHFVKIDRTYEISTIEVANTDGSLVHLLVFHDITVRKQAEGALIEARHAAELASRAKTEFIANMSHELRTPLNAILGFSDLMQSEPYGPLGHDRYRSYLADIHGSGRHLLAVISDILDVARIESGQTDLLEEEVDLGELARSCKRMLAERARDGGVELVESIEPPAVMVRADERRLKQALVNLLANAVKFTLAGGRVGVAVGLRRGEPVIEVRDNGIGMHPAEIPRALKPFVQLDEGLARRFDGTGLGLPLTKALVELHQGTLEIESAKGGGTTARIRLPSSRLTQGAGAVPTAIGTAVPPPVADA